MSESTLTEPLINLRTVFGKIWPERVMCPTEVLDPLAGDGDMETFQSYPG
jgi:hypothetical protein